MEELGELDDDVQFLKNFANEEPHYFHMLTMHLEVTSKGIS